MFISYSIFNLHFIFNIYLVQGKLQRTNLNKESIKIYNFDLIVELNSKSILNFFEHLFCKSH